MVNRQAPGNIHCSMKKLPLNHIFADARIRAEAVRTILFNVVR
jgi:hypothetical protein